MKTIFKIVASLCAGLFAVGCQQFYVDTQMTPEKAAASIKLECDALDSYTIQGEKPQSVSFKVAATTPWVITGWEKAEWLKVSPVSSALSSLSEDIVITAAANPTFEDRSCTIIIQDEAKQLEAHTVVINQSRKGKLYVQPVVDVFEATGSTLPFTIETNLAWEVRAADQWLSFSKTSGTGDGKVQTVNATAAANASVVRSTTVTVTAGDDKFSFEVTQKGQSLEFGDVESTEIDRLGGELVIPVKATMDWKYEVSNNSMEIEKVGNDQLKVVAPFNDKFAEKSVTITIKPTSDDFGDVSSSITLTQGVNFDLTGNCEVLEDGSVKMTGDQKTRIVTKDGLRYVSLVFEIGDKQIGDDCQMWCCTHDAGSSGNTEYQCQLSLNGKMRLRSNGGGTEYNTSSITISKDELKAINEYRMDFVPDNGQIKLEFFYNGTSKKSMSSKSVYETEPDAVGHYFFGWDSAASASTWYVVKSCKITVK